MIAFALSPAADWTLFFVLYGVLFILCVCLGTAHITRHGHLDLFWDMSGLYEVIFSLLLLAVVVLVVAPFFGLFEIGCWVYGRFSPEARRAHAEARKLKKPRNPRLEQDRIARRLAASKQRAARHTKVQAGEADPAKDADAGSAPNE